MLLSLSVELELRVHPSKNQSCKMHLSLILSASPENAQTVLSNTTSSTSIQHQRAHRCFIPKQSRPRHKADGSANWGRYSPRQLASALAPARESTNVSCNFIMTDATPVWDHPFHRNLRRPVLGCIDADFATNTPPTSL